MDKILKYFSPPIRKILSGLPEKEKKSVNEVRMCIGKPLMLDFCEKDSILPYVTTHTDMKTTLELVSCASVYAVKEEISRGFLTLEGGSRVGISGKAVIRDGEITFLKEISGLCFRVSRQITGCANKVMNQILQGDLTVKNTLVISPPGCGKTTLLRDIARLVSNRGQKKVAVVDERSEIAATYQGVAQMDVGIRTFVLDSCPKSKGMIMAIRSLSPQVLITDELGCDADIESLYYAIHSGVSVITSIHGFGIDDVMRKPMFEKMLRENIFQTIIVLSKKNGAGTVERIEET